MFYLICYDIVSDRRRTQIAYLLESYGFRVQQSVFECLLDDKQYATLSDKIGKIINKKEDQVRFYPLNKSCRTKVLILGIKPEFSVDSSAFIL